MDTNGLLLAEQQLNSIRPKTPLSTLYDDLPNLINSSGNENNKNWNNDFQNLDYNDDIKSSNTGGSEYFATTKSILSSFFKLNNNDGSSYGISSDNILNQNINNKVNNNNNNNYNNNNFNLVLNSGNSEQKYNNDSLMNNLIGNLTNNNFMNMTTATATNLNNNNLNFNNFNYVYDNSIIDTTILNTNFNNNNNNFINSNFNNNTNINFTNIFQQTQQHDPQYQQPSEFDLLYRHSLVMTIVYCIAYAIVFIVGLIGNSFVIAVVLRAPRMRTVTNFFIVNLAIADILVIVFCLPATLMGNIFVPWVLGWLMCKTVPYIQGVSVAASVYSLIAVSLDRFIAIWWPLKQMTKSRARFMIFCIWIIALSSTIPWALFFNLIPAAEAFPAAPNMLLCVEVWPPGTDGNLYFLLANLVTCYLLPMALITLCYVLIWIKVSTRSIPGDSKDAQMDRMQQKSKVKVVKMLVVVVILFVLSWLPLYAIFARIKFGGEITQDEGEILNTITPMAQWLGSSNSCINPILYAFFNKKYRRGFAAIIKSRTCCGRLRYYDNVAIASSSTSTRKSSHYQNGAKKGPNSPSTKSNAVSYIYEHNSVRKHNVIVKQDSNLSQQMLIKQDSHGGSRQMLIKQESSCSDASSRQILLKQDSSGSRNSLIKQDSVISYIETRRGQLIRQDSDISKQDTISIDSRRGILAKQDLQISCIDNNNASNTNRNNFNSSKSSFSSQDSCASLIEHKRHRLVKQDSIISFADQRPEPRRHQLVKQDSVISFADQKRSNGNGFLYKQDSIIAYPNNNRSSNGDVYHHVSILKKTDSQNSANSSPKRNIEFAD